MSIRILATVDPAHSRVDARTDDDHRVAMDVGPPEGQGTAAEPKEVLLSALAGCTSMDVASILRKKRQVATSYEVAVSGESAEEHPKVLRTITVEHRVAGERHGRGAASIDRAVRDAVLPGERDALGVGDDRALVPADRRRRPAWSRRSWPSPVRRAAGSSEACAPVTRRCGAPARRRAPGRPRRGTRRDRMAWRRPDRSAPARRAALGWRRTRRRPGCRARRCAGAR